MNKKREDIVVDIVVIVAIIAIIILKLTNVLKLSWWLILAPIWMSFALGIVLMLLFLMCVVIRGIIDMIKENKNERN